MISKFKNTTSMTDNSGKCDIIKICQDDRKYPYGEQDYLGHTHSPHIRSIITKLRIDSNCTLDSLSRGYKGKKPLSTMCTHCNSTQNVKHVLLYCNLPEIQDARKSFEAKYIKFVDHFRKHDDNRKVSQIVAVDPYCKSSNRPGAINCIYSYIKTLYNAINVNPVLT